MFKCQSETIFAAAPKRRCKSLNCMAFGGIWKTSVVFERLTEDCAVCNSAGFSYGYGSCTEIEMALIYTASLQASPCLSQGSQFKE